MQSSALPSRIPKKWAAAASGTYVRDIPEASQIGTTPGAASYTDGFVPLNATAIASGGIPPDVRDMNGILRAVTQGLQWFQAGGYALYNGAFSTAISGYPKGALLASSANDGTYWLNGTEDNTNDPDVTPTGWTRLRLNATARLPAAAPTDGQTLIGKTDGTFAVANITAGKNTTVTNADGSITIGNTIGLAAFCNFNGTGTPAIRRAGNVSSITDYGLGSYGLNFTTPMVDANYTVLGLTSRGDDSNVSIMIDEYNPPTTTQVRIRTGAPAQGYYSDRPYINVGIIS